MSAEIASIQLLGNRFPVLWQSGDHRQFANRERCYELVSFEGMEQHDLDVLRKGPPVTIEKCWLPNLDYKHNASREYYQWNHVTGRGYGRRCQHHPPERGGFYCPPEAADLRFINPKDPQVSTNPSKRMQAALTLLAIGSELFHIPCSGPGAAVLSKPGAPIYLATFGNGDIRFLKDVVECALPSEARASFQSADLQASVERVLKQSQDHQANLEATRNQLQRTQEAAAMKLEEALGKWMRFDPPGMKANTKARVSKAVHLYVTDPDKRSLAKIAAEFKVSRTTVSRWFKAFTQHTDFPVVTHARHESVKSHLEAEIEDKRRQGEAGDCCQDNEAE